MQCNMLVGKLGNMFTAGAALTTLYFATKHSGIVRIPKKAKKTVGFDLEEGPDEEEEDAMSPLETEEEVTSDQSGEEEEENALEESPGIAAGDTRVMLDSGNNGTATKVGYAVSAKDGRAVSSTLSTTFTICRESHDKGRCLSTNSVSGLAACPENDRVDELADGGLRVVEVLSTISLSGNQGVTSALETTVLNGNDEAGVSLLPVTEEISITFPSQNGMVRQRCGATYSTTCTSCEESLRNVDDYVFENEEVIKFRRDEAGADGAVEGPVPAIGECADRSTASVEMEPATSSCGNAAIVDVSNPHCQPSEASSGRANEFAHRKDPSSAQLLVLQNEKGQLDVVNVQKSEEGSTETGSAEATPATRNLTWWLDSDAEAGRNRDGAEIKVGMRGMKLDMGDGRPELAYLAAGLENSPRGTHACDEHAASNSLMKCQDDLCCRAHCQPEEATTTRTLCQSKTFIREDTFVQLQRKSAAVADRPVVAERTLNQGGTLPKDEDDSEMTRTLPSELSTDDPPKCSVDLRSDLNERRCCCLCNEAACFHNEKIPHMRRRGTSSTSSRHPLKAKHFKPKFSVGDFTECAKPRWKY